MEEGEKRKECKMGEKWKTKEWATEAGAKAGTKARAYAHTTELLCIIIIIHFINPLSW